MREDKAKIRGGCRHYTVDISVHSRPEWSSESTSCRSSRLLLTSSPSDPRVAYVCHLTCPLATGPRTRRKKKYFSHVRWKWNQPDCPAFLRATVNIIDSPRTRAWKRVPLRNRNFTAISSSNIRTVAVRHRHAANHNKHCWQAFQGY